ncbi:DNA-cytosine methyltransferase [hydrothermal vent metagenome]|uniref:DNA-cytosine methyltransferase n=1 Tax=hydrothermal vent metagenome TaxID=652676 RepID=A0A3B0W5I9_9ZZZZ
MLKVLDLFSGIGGFSLGLERAGMKTVAFCETETYPISILKKHWPTIPVFEDVRKLKGDQLEQIDIITGGFPCQPFSVAGKQKGKEDNRYLWPEMFRLIQECRPSWVIGENVTGLVRMALDDVLFDLESEGYATRTFIIPACAVGGKHRRERLWIVAHSEHNGQLAAEKQRSKKQAIHNDPKRQDEASELERVCLSSNVANTNSEGRKRESITGGNESVRKKSDDEQLAGCCGSQQFRPINPPAEPSVRCRTDGLPDNVARLKALGNAVVPQIPEIIGRQIMAIESL